MKSFMIGLCALIILSTCSGCAGAENTGELTSPVSIENAEAGETTSDEVLREYQRANAVSPALEEKSSGTAEFDVKAEVERIRNNYYTTQAQMDTFREVKGEDGTVWYLNSNGQVVKLRISSDSYEGERFDRHYDAECYYENNRLYFVFVFRQKEEYRFYLKNGKCVRYIDGNARIHDYPDGVSPEEVSPVGEFCTLAAMELHWAGFYP